MDHPSVTPLSALLLWLFAIAVAYVIYWLVDEPGHDDEESELESRSSDATPLRFSCHSCGALLPEAFRTMRLRSAPYCDACVTPTGELKPYNAVLSATASLLKGKGRSARQAEEAARLYLRRMPAWSRRESTQHPSARSSRDRAPAS